MDEFRDLEHVDWFLTQSIKRDAVEEKIDAAFRAGRPVRLPAKSVWQAYPCDVCAKPVGAGGHLGVVYTDFKLGKKTNKRASLSVRCDTCETVWVGMMAKKIVKKRYKKL